MNNSETNSNCRLVSAKTLGKILSLSTRSVWRYRSSGLLPKPAKISGAIRWKLSDIDLFLGCDCDMQRFNAEKGVAK